MVLLLLPPMLLAAVLLLLLDLPMPPEVEEGPPPPPAAAPLRPRPRPHVHHGERQQNVDDVVDARPRAETAGRREGKTEVDESLDGALWSRGVSVASKTGTVTEFGACMQNMLSRIHIQPEPLRAPTSGLDRPVRLSNAHSGHCSNQVLLHSASGSL